MATGVATQLSATTLQFESPRELSDQNSQGTILGSSTTDLIGFFGLAVGVPQQTPAGNVTTVTAGSTTNVFVNTSFSGGVGTTAYTVGDIVAILKALGLFKL
jgi:hypothetical protein